MLQLPRDVFEKLPQSFFMLSRDREWFAVEVAALGHRIDKGTSSEPGIFKPALQDVGDDLKLRTMPGKSGLNLFGEPSHPYIVALMQKRQNEILFRGKVLIEYWLRNTGSLNNLAYLGPFDSVAVEEFQRRMDDAVSLILGVSK